METVEGGDVPMVHLFFLQSVV